jgi:VCBS repeat-containing protein
VSENTEYEGQIQVTNHGLLGGANFEVVVSKKNESGQYAQVQKFEGASGGLLGAANTLKFDLATLTEGEYAFILSPGVGFTLANGVSFNVVEQKVNNYSDTATGNLVTEQNYDGFTKVTKVGGQEISAEGTTIADNKGTLTVNQDGTYKYVMDRDKAIQLLATPGASDTVTFDYTVTDETGEKTVTATLEITIES